MTKSLNKKQVKGKQFASIQEWRRASLTSDTIEGLRALDEKAEQDLTHILSTRIDKALQSQNLFLN